MTPLSTTLYRFSAKKHIAQRVLHKRHPVIAGNHAFHTSNSRFEQNVIKSKYKDVKLSTQNYFEFIWESRHKHGKRLALVSDGENSQGGMQLRVFILI
jgi:hypothetical protein